jgi:dynein heavy chain
MNKVMFRIMMRFMSTVYSNMGFLTSCRGEQFDRSLVHSIESIIIDWSHQIQNVLKRDSAQPLLEGTNPGPMVELDFWKARAENLECIFEQV